jgi:hypothetical protein
VIDFLLSSKILFVQTEKTKVKNIDTQIKKKSKNRDETDEFQSQQTLDRMSSRKDSISFSFFLISTF